MTELTWKDNFATRMDDLAVEWQEHEWNLFGGRPTYERCQGAFCKEKKER